MNNIEKCFVKMSGDKNNIIMYIYNKMTLWEYAEIKVLVCV